MKLYLASDQPGHSIAIGLTTITTAAPRYALPVSFPVFKVAELFASRRPYSVERADFAHQDDSGDASRVLAGGAL